MIRLGDLRGGGSRASFRILIIPLQCPCRRLIATARHTTFTRRALRLSRVRAAANELSRLLRSLLLTHADCPRVEAQVRNLTKPIIKLLCQLLYVGFSYLVGSCQHYHITPIIDVPTWYKQCSIFYFVKRNFPEYYRCSL